MVRRKTDPPKGVLKTTSDATSGLVHERYHPRSDLATWVEHHWSVAWDFRGRPPHPVATLPHPSVHLVFDGDRGGELAGPARARFSRELAGVGSVFAVKFRPGGFRPFSDGPVSRLADKVVPVTAVFGVDGARLDEAVHAAASDDARVAVVEDFLRVRIPAPDHKVNRAAELVYGVARDRSIIKVQDLVDSSGLSLRSLQRLFAEYVGVSPKWVIQRYRLHEAAERLASGAADHASLALELGYSDQAHFIRDFKALVGSTPAAYARQAGQDQTR